VSVGASSTHNDMQRRSRGLEDSCEASQDGASQDATAGRFADAAMHVGDQEEEEVFFFLGDQLIRECM
jgi:hypothetical protein